MSPHEPHDASHDPAGHDPVGHDFGGHDPAGIEPVDPDGSQNPPGDGDLDISNLPSVLRESAWGRMDDQSAKVDPWLLPRPYHGGDETLQARRRLLAGRLGVVVAAAVIGGIAGALLVGGSSERSADPDAEEVVAALRGSIGQLAAEVRSLRDGVGAGSQATAAGLAAIEQRIGGAETAQADLSARIAGLAEARSAPPVAAPAVSPEITGSIAPAPLPVADDWILWRVRNGRALVQGGAGYFEVETGSDLPGLGIVQRIVRRDGRWMVFTPYAVIVSRD